MVVEFYHDFGKSKPIKIKIIQNCRKLNQLQTCNGWLIYCEKGMLWNGMEGKFQCGIFILAHFNVVFILSAVNKAAFDQTHKMIKEKSSS